VHVGMIILRLILLPYHLNTLALALVCFVILHSEQVQMTFVCLMALVYCIFNTSIFLGFYPFSLYEYFIVL
jgi:hypothetical protein